MKPVGSVVQSTAGRDKGALYIVVGKLDYPYVWVADGRKYKADKPKKKIAGISGVWKRTERRNPPVPYESVMNGSDPY